MSTPTAWRRGALTGADSQPILVADLASESPTEAARSAVGFTVINFNTAAQTLRCVASLVDCDEPPAWILVLDNASARADYERLRQGLTRGRASRIRLFRSEVNLGFAQGSNFLIDELLATEGCAHVGLLNNDAVALPGLVGALRGALTGDGQGGGTTGMSGGRMHRLAKPQEVDTLGITLYSSLMPADRKDPRDPYLGPTGGCCLMARAFVERVKAVCGYCFDPSFFCYCEDTDLALRANLLGYSPAYADQLVALHEGQASSGGGHNDFIAYHGLRNAMWMQWKLIPAALLWRKAPQLMLAHLLTIGRQLLGGRGRLLVQVYADALRALGRVRGERRRFEEARSGDGPERLRRAVSPRFYRQGYSSVVLGEWRQLWRARSGRR